MQLLGYAHGITVMIPSDITCLVQDLVDNNYLVWLVIKVQFCKVWLLVCSGARISKEHERSNNHNHNSSFLL